jgi:hypothetical protein
MYTVVIFTRSILLSGMLVSAFWSSTTEEKQVNTDTGALIFLTVLWSAFIVGALYVWIDKRRNK